MCDNMYICMWFKQTKHFAYIYIYFSDKSVYNDFYLCQKNICLSVCLFVCM